MERIIKRAYAKINLFLDIASRYTDGYHEVHTVMQSVSLFDDVSVELGGENIEITCDVEGVPTDNRNIVRKAAELFFSELPNEPKQGVRVSITKRIPMAAGLAGGSADAAAFLCGINELMGSPISFERLLDLGAKLGADVPFCMVGGTAYADARGDKLHTLPSLEKYCFVIACGGEGVSTPWAYRELDTKFDNFSKDVYTPHDVNAFKKKLADGDISGIYNIFEEVILPERPVDCHIKNTLINEGAICAMMSGSGPSVFGVFENETVAKKAAKAILASGYFAQVATPVMKLL